MVRVVARPARCSLQLAKHCCSLLAGLRSLANRHHALS